MKQPQEYKTEKTKMETKKEITNLIDDFEKVVKKLKEQKWEFDDDEVIRE